MNDPSGRKALATLLVGVTAIGALYVWSIFRPIHARTSRLRERLAQLQSQVSAHPDRSQRMEKLVQERAELEQILTSWRQNQAAAGPLAERLAWISSTARECGVTIQRFSPQRDVPGDVLSQNFVSLALEGEVAGMFSFLRALDAQPGSVWTTELTIRPDRDAQSKVTAQVELSIITDKHGISG